MPAYTEQVDYELEWGIFIGKEGRDIPKDQAREYIGRYTIFNDFSARDMQMQEMGDGWVQLRAEILTQARPHRLAYSHPTKFPIPTACT